MSDEFDPQVEIKKLSDKLEQTDKNAEIIMKSMTKSKDVDKNIKINLIF